MAGTFPGYFTHGHVAHGSDNFREFKCQGTEYVLHRLTICTDGRSLEFAFIDIITLIRPYGVESPGEVTPKSYCDTILRALKEVLTVHTCYTQYLLVDSIECENYSS